MSKTIINVENITCEYAHIQKPTSNNSTAASTNITVNVYLHDTGHRRENPERPPGYPLLIAVIILLLLLLLCSLSCAELGDGACALCATLLKVLGAIL